MSKETINALAEAGAIMFAPNNILKAAELTLFGLEKRGYTIARTKPATLSSGEVSVYIKNIEDIISVVDASVTLDLLANLDGISAHIAELEADNKRLREALFEIRCHGLPKNGTGIEGLICCHKIAETALSQTDGKAVSHD